MISKVRRIREAVRDELSLHPEVTLIDLYKYFFQGAFGPGHIIRDKETARQQLKDELRTASEYEPVLWQSVGYDDQYYRVNIRLVKEGTIGIDTLINAIIRSIDGSSHPSVNEWLKEWKFIEAIIADMDILDKESSSNRHYTTVLTDLLKSQLVNLIVHHSKEYRRYYHPHYRLISKKELSKLNLLQG